ncbi:MAG: mechanosensitive ion channel [Aureispira sp.]|nr:mechanosensitive ion channel [Aureispira sp.]
MWNKIVDWFNGLSNGLTEMQSKLLVTGIILILLWLLRRLVTRSISRTQLNPMTKYNWNKTSSYIIYIGGVIGIAFTWSNHFESFATFLGLLSAGLAIAFKDPIVNVAGWYYIIFQKPFKVGDRIQIGAEKGDVIDTNWFQFTIIEIGNWVNDEQSTGRIIHIPNSKVFSTPLANYNAGIDHIWNEIDVLITFESDWKRGKQLFLEVLLRHAPQVSDQAQKELSSSSGEYLIYYKKFTPIVYTQVKDCGVLLSLRYLCEPKQRRTSTSLIWETILDIVNDDPSLDFAYPTRRTIMLGNRNFNRPFSTDDGSDKVDMDGAMDVD